MREGEFVLFFTKSASVSQTHPQQEDKKWFQKPGFLMTNRVFSGAQPEEGSTLRAEAGPFRYESRRIDFGVRCTLTRMWPGRPEISVTHYYIIIYDN